MKNAQSGFTLIELMIVIAIIGILASVAIPQYQVYTQRSEATTAMGAMRSIQLGVQEFAATQGSLPDDLASLAPYGLDTTPANYAAGTVSEVDVLADGVIEITFASDAPENLKDNTLLITPTIGASGMVTFSIRTGTNGGTVDAKYRPNL
jgi:type IV pilus assembly protein PilA